MNEPSDADVSQLKRAVSELSVLNDIAGAINVSMSVDDITKLILDKCLAQVGAAQGAIYLLDDHRDRDAELKTFVRQSGAADGGIPLHLSESIAGWMIKYETPLVYNSGEKDSAPHRLDLTKSNIETLLAVPLITRNKLIGTLAIFNKKEGKPFDQHDKRLVGIIGTQTAKIIENARLFARETKLLSQIHSDRIAALSRLVAGIAHEFNTPAGAISSSHDLLARAAANLQKQISTACPENCWANPDNQKAFKIFDDSLRVAVQGCTRIAGIVKNLRSFAVLDQAELQLIDVHRGLKDSLDLLAHRFGSGIRIIERYGEISRLTCYPAQINQVFYNVLLNAIEAMPAKGTITITTDERDGFIHVEIRDTGTGIPQNDLPKIYDPGFTTKGVGVGVGLGLSICHQIIQSHHGTIEVTSEAGQGTTVTIALPTNPAPVDDNTASLNG